MTLAETIQAKMLRREELRVELEALESELIDAGAILSVSVVSAAFLRRRGRLVNGDSCRAKILTVVSDGRDWPVRDVLARIPHKNTSVMSQLSRMVAEGNLIRVRHGIVRSGVITGQADAVDPVDGSDHDLTTREKGSS